MARTGFGSKYDTTRPLSRSEAADVSAGDHEFSELTRSILVTTDGDVTLRLAGDAADLTLTVAAGTLLPFIVSHIRRASTAAIIGLW